MSKRVILTILAIVIIIISIVAIVKYKLINIELFGNNKMIGGFMMGAQTWQGANTICPGKFGNHNVLTPSPRPSNVWLTLGGEGVTTPETDSQIRDDVRQLNATGIIYDTEGWVTIEGAVQMANKYKSLVQNHVLCAQIDGQVHNYDSAFAYIAPMMYWGSDSYQGQITASWIDGQLQRWSNAGWPKNKIILTFQSASAGADSKGRQILLNLINKLKNEGYAGLLGWPDYITKKDASNLQIINSNL